MNKIFALLLALLAFMNIVPSSIAEGWSWTSSDESVVCVRPDGSFVVAGIGTATLTGMAQDGETVTITLTVPEEYAVKDSEAQFVGNLNTKKFHRFDCTSVNDINAGHMMRLESREDALKQGFVPCKRCDP